MRLKGLWLHQDFLKLWVGQTISEFGSQITQLALPLTAVVMLNATPGQMGLLNALTSAPFLLIAVFAGVWVDRWQRRWVLIWSDVGRTLLLAAIPVAFLLGRLRIEVLYAVGLLTGVLTVFFDVAYQAFLPSLVGRDQLIEGNSKLQVTGSAAQIAGPGLAGILVQVFSAPVAIFLDALSFLVSWVSLLFVRAREPAQQPAAAGGPSFWGQVGEGLSVVFGNRLLRPIAACTATSNLFSSMLFAIYILYLTRSIGLSPGLIGTILAAGNIGFLAGALVAGRLARRFGLGRVIVLSIAIGSLSAFVVPLVPHQPVVATVLLTASQILWTFTIPAYNINQVSLRQAITPERLQGRMNATMRFIVWGTMPLGALLGGALGEALGLVPTLWIAALGGTLSFLWTLFSPVWALQTMPEPVGEEAG